MSGWVLWGMRMKAAHRGARLVRCSEVGFCTTKCLMSTVSHNHILRFEPLTQYSIDLQDSLVDLKSFDYLHVKDVEK